MKIYRIINTRLNDISFYLNRNIKVILSNVSKFLSHPIWNGLGVIVMIIVALSVFMLSQQIEKSRYEEDIANIELVNFDIISPIEYEISENGTRSSLLSIYDIYDIEFNDDNEEYKTVKKNPWLVFMNFVNIVPAQAEKMKIEIKCGGRGIRAVEEPILSPGNLDSELKDRFITYIFREEGEYYEAIHEIMYEIMIDELLIDDGFFIIQKFYVSDDVDLELRKSKNYRSCGRYFNNIHISGFTISDLDLNLGCEYYRMFVKEIRLKGYHTRQNWEWSFSSDLFSN